LLTWDIEAPHNKLRGISDVMNFNGYEFSMNYIIDRQANVKEHFMVLIADSLWLQAENFIFLWHLNFDI